MTEEREVSQASTAPPQDDISRATANELLSHFSAKSLSPVAATEALLRRIEALDPAINAFLRHDRRT